MIANLLMGFDDRAVVTARTKDINGNDHPVTKVLGAPDTPGQFQIYAPGGPRTYELWSMFFDADTDQDVRDIRSDLVTEFPGQLRTEGAWWYDDGREVGTDFEFGDVTRSTTIDDPAYVAPAIPQVQNPNYQGPNVGLNDIGPPNGEPEFIDDPAYIAPPVPQVAGMDQTTNEIIGVIGTPTYALDARMIEFMPDDVVYDLDGLEVSRSRPTVLSQVNVLIGQSERQF